MTSTSAENSNSDYDLLDIKGTGTVNPSSVNYHGCSNGYDGTACQNGAESKQVKKSCGKPTQLHGSSILRFGQQNGDNVPAVVSSGPDDLVNLDDLRIAIQKNSVSAVERMLSFGLDVNGPLSSGWTALMYAAHSSALECINCLLRHGADPNSHKDQYTALMAACASTCESDASMVETIRNLLAAGANVNASDRHSMTPLMYASRQGRAAVVKILLPLTNNINQQDNKGYTALMWAVNSGQTQVVRILIDAGADISVKKSDGKCAFDIASAKGHKELRQMLSTNGDNSSAVVNTSDTAAESAGGQVHCSTSVTNGTPSAVNSNFVNVPSAATSQSNFDWTKTSSVSYSGDGRSQAAPVGVGVCDTMLPSTNAASEASTQSGVITYGELEVFLSGLDLNALIPTFQQQQVSFSTFLRLTDVDLQQMGVTQLGVRKKILDAIRETHKRNWETSSLASIQYNKKISCAESVVMLANIKQHAAYIASTVGYINDQILADDKIVLDAPQDTGAGAKDLSINVEEAMTNVKNLFAELVTLRKQLEKICHNRDFRPPELVPKRRRRKSRWSRMKTWHRVAVFGGAVVGFATVVAVFGRSVQLQ